MEISILVLKSFRPFCRVFTIYNLENFQNTNLKLLVYNYCQCITLLGVLLWYFLSGFCYCVDAKFNMKIVAHSMSLLIGAFQIVCIHVSLSVKNRKIAEALEFLQRIVQNRKITKIIELKPQPQRQLKTRIQDSICFFMNTIRCRL